MGEVNGYLPFPKGFQTMAIHAGQEPEQWATLSVVPPIIMSTIFKQHTPEMATKYIYGRDGNPTRKILEVCIASLEEAKYGICFASGMAAISAVFELLQVGDQMICSDDIYTGSYELFSKIGFKNGITVIQVDTTNIENLKKVITHKTKMVWIESPSNPLLKVTDIAATAEITKLHNILLAVDNTFLTPYLQKPLKLGADISVSSLTKYMNGHSDILMGAVMVNYKELHDKLRFFQSGMGAVPSPFDCAQVIRGLKTLAIRMIQHNKNGLAVAKYLEKHNKIDKVLHPGLPSHPQHQVFKSQTSGHSGMVSVYVKGGFEETKKFIASLKVFSLANSLGGFESLVEVPYFMSHESLPLEKKSSLNITENLIRISVGLEDTEDLITDLEQALKHI